MKLKLLFGLLLITFQSVFAQNWTLFNPDFEYYYSNEESGKVDHAVKVDSFQVDGTDTIFHFNRLVRYNVDPDEQDESSIVINDRNIFGYHFTKSNNIYTFFLPNVPDLIFDLDDTNSTFEKINGHVVKREERKVFNITDSVIEVEFEINKYTSYFFEISKKIGVLSFQNTKADIAKLYELIGVRTLTESFGTVSFGYDSIFDFKIGDTFFYSETSSCFCQITPSTRTSLYRMEVIEVVDSTTTTKYKMELKGVVIKEDYGIPYGSPFYFKKEVDYMEYHKAGFEGYEENIFSKKLVNSDLNQLYEFRDFSVHSFVSIGIDTSDNRKIKFIGLKNSESTHLTNYVTIPYDVYKILYSENPFSLKTYDEVAGDLYIEWKEGVGLTEYLLSVGEVFFEFKMVGYIKDGKEYGEIYGDDVLTSIKTKDENFSVFPIPSQGIFQIEVPLEWNDSKITVLDMLGNEIYTDDYSVYQPIVNASVLKEGIYLLQLQKGNRFLSQKISIVK